MQTAASFLKTKWHEVTSFLCLVAIALHFAFSSNLPLFLLITIGGAPLLLQILRKAFKGDLGADILAALGLVTALFLGEYMAATLVVLMLASGQAIEVYAVRKASFALEALAKRMPSIAHKKIGSRVQDIDTSAIQIGDLLEIYPHETCPIDGLVIEGHGDMDESYLTGEPYFISKAPGSKVLCGAVNGNFALTICAETLPKDSRYANIIKVMESAQAGDLSMRRIADKIGAIFAPLALAFALGTWLVTQSATKFLAVLVVATPCPLLIAIPVAIIAAISIAARHGIIIKDPVILERLPTCQTAIFDKTGTLTRGKPELVNIIAFDGFEKNQLLQIAASLERYSRHPLSVAIIEAAKKEKIELLEVENIAEKPGQGMLGNLEGKEVLLTSRKKISAQLEEKLPKLDSGLECVLLVNSKLAGVFHFFDMPQEDGHFFINHLGPTHNFKKIMILSGDRESEVRQLAKMLEIKEIYFEKSPEEKLEIIKKENSLAPTLYMGDGINDAPALVAATAGIAFGGNENSSSVVSEAAKAVIMENSLTKVDQLIHISESMRRIALQSAIGGMALSFVGMGFAAAGLISPVGAALLQEVIDVVAILNCLRLTLRSKIPSDLTT
jgi:heavy metal translocating P-type ATPase